MSGYRFCRSDDIPLLVEAYNRCYQPFVEDAEPWDIHVFRRLAKEIDLWTSSCMVTVVQDQVVGVMLATKREGQMLVLGVGVLPEHRRAEHGRHMLRSLSAKLAILGPPRMTCEIPTANREGIAFVEACNYQQDRTYTDYVWAGPMDTEPFEPPFIQQIEFADLEAAEVFKQDSWRCWDRSFQTLKNRSDSLTVWGVPSMEGWDAWLIEDVTGEDQRLLLELGAQPGEKGERLKDLLVRRMTAAKDTRPVKMPKVCPEENLKESLERWGFSADKTYSGFFTTPVPA